MKKMILRTCLLGLLAAGIAGTSADLRAQEMNRTNKHNKAAVEKHQPASRRSGVIPFHGKLKTVDNKMKTITVGNRKFAITSETRIQKAGKPATLKDGVVGEPVSGGYKKAADGKLVATTVHFGPKQAKARTRKKGAAGNTD